MRISVEKNDPGGIGEEGFDTLTGMRIDLPPSHEMGKATGGVASGLEFGLIGEHSRPFLAEHTPAIKRTLTEEEGAGETVSIDIAFEQPLTWPHGGLKGYDPQTIIVDDPFAESYVSADELRAWYTERFTPRRSHIAALMAARRARAAKRKPTPFTTEHDEGVHRAISAFNRAGAERRANEL